jgi:hypothetical protein
MIVWTLLLVFTLSNGDVLKQRIDTYSTLKECTTQGILALKAIKGRKVKAQCVSGDGALI